MENKVLPKLNIRGKIRQIGRKSLKYAGEKGKQNIIIIGATIVLFIIFAIINDGFADKLNVLTMAQSLAPYAFLGLGVTFVIATGGIDLSIGTVCIAASTIAGTFYMMGMPLWLTLPIMLIVGLLFGYLNGLLIAKLKLPAFIATLGTMMFSRGISAVLAKALADAVTISYPTGTWFQKVFSNLNDFPIALVWLIVLTIVCMYVMYKSRVGRYILAIGSNEEATRLSGVKTDRYKILAYTICGLFAGVAAIFWTAANPTITTATGNGMELDAIAGVYIGGTSSTGGIASIVGSVLGAMILVIIRQGLNMTLGTFSSNISATHITYAITGIIVVGAVLLDVIKTKSMNRVKIEGKAKKLKRTTAEHIEALRVEKDYELSRGSDVEYRARAAQKSYNQKAKEEIATLAAEERPAVKITEIRERNFKCGKEEADAIRATKQEVEERAKNRIAEIDAEIAELKKKQAEELPMLKKEDVLAKEAVKKQKEEAKRTEKEERAKRTRKNG